MKQLLILLIFMAVIPIKSDAGFIVSSGNGDLAVKKEQVFKYAATNEAYRYFIQPVTESAPIGFRTSFDLNNGDLAGPAEGYTDVDAHGWPCKRLEKKEFGVTYRVYRFLNFLDFAFTLTVITEEIE